MVVKRGGLGRNLSALLGTAHGTDLLPHEGEHIIPVQLAIDQLQAGKYQPRREMDESSLESLAESIKKQGLLQPLVVREVQPLCYEIIAGERRWRACRLAGLEKVPVIVRQVDDETALAIALVENLQREDLNAMDQARAMQRLSAEFDLTHQEVADLLSKSRAAVSNYFRLFQLCPEVQRMLEHGDLEMGHARCLLTLNAEEQHQIAQWIVSRQLSVRETEALVARMKKTPKSQLEKEPSHAFEHTLQRLTKQWEAQFYLKPGKTGTGRLVIHYNHAQCLEELLGQLLDVNTKRSEG